MKFGSYITAATRHSLMIVLIVGAVLPSSLWARDPEGASNSTAAIIGPAATNPTSPATPALNEQLAQQQARIERLEQALEKVTRRLDELMDAQRATNSASPDPGRVASMTPIMPARIIRGAEVDPGRLAASPVVPPVVAVVPPVIASSPPPPPAEANKPPASPLAFKIGDAEFTPGGFMDFTTVFRTTNLGSGVATSFGTIPYSVIGGMPNPAGQMTEIRNLAQNSRISMKITSQVGGIAVAGYIEGDFAGNNPSNLYVTSNSNTFRLRHYYVQLTRGKFEVVGGQAWSLMTPGRTGISPWSNDLFISQVQDSYYQLGITWGRQSQLRMVYHPSKEWAMALSLENPNQYLSTGVVLPGSSFNGEFDMAGSQTTTPNLLPEIVTKIAYDPSVKGKHMHAEVGGILRTFRSFNPSNNSTSTISGGGVTAGVNFEVLKDFHLIANGFYSSGGGRYIDGLGPDVIVRPDGNLSGVHAGTGVAGFEYQMNPRVMVFGYYGGAYFQRNTGYTLDATGKPVWVGFGAPAPAATELNANRAVQEPTFGFARTFWKSPRLGSLLWVNQYSYVTRAPWIVPVGSGKNAHLSVVYTDLRYILP